jgi:hypothetical protein
MKSLCQTLSVLIGVVCAGLLFLGIIPLLGWTLWLTLALCVVGIVFGAFPERKIGLTINVAVGAVGVLRLFLGGGIL